jgi:hypothetical protein
LKWIIPPNIFYAVIGLALVSLTREQVLEMVKVVDKEMGRKQI